MIINPENTYTALIKTLNPIAHGDTSLQDKSNETVFMRSKRVVNGNVINLPDISENAVRHVIFREPLANHLLNAIKVERESLSKAVVSLFFNGGNMNEKSPGDVNTLARQIYGTFPMLELLGGAVNQFILPRSALKLVVLPISKEYMPYLDGVMTDNDRELIQENSLLSIFDFLSTETRTRYGDSMMIYGYETLAAGAQFFIRATLSPHTSVLAKSALGLGLKQWDCFFGGMSRQGRGLCAIQRHTFPDDDVYESYIKKQEKYLRDVISNGTFGTEKVVCWD